MEKQYFDELIDYIYTENFFKPLLTKKYLPVDYIVSQLSLKPEPVGACEEPREESNADLEFIRKINSINSIISTGTVYKYMVEKINALFNEYDLGSVISIYNHLSENNKMKESYSKNNYIGFCKNRQFI